MAGDAFKDRQTSLENEFFHRVDAKLLEQLRKNAQDEKDGAEEETMLTELRALFCQMDVLCHFDDGVMGWKEAAR